MRSGFLQRSKASGFWAFDDQVATKVITVTASEENLGAAVERRLGEVADTDYWRPSRSFRQSHKAENAQADGNHA